MQYQKNKQHTQKLKELEICLESALGKVFDIQQHDTFTDDEVKDITMSLFKAGIAWVEFKDTPTRLAAVGNKNE